MNTACYDSYKGSKGVSIAGRCPDSYAGREYKKLAPKLCFWEKWHNGEYTDNDYVKYYYLEVLDKLDAQQVYDELGEDSVLLCHEPGELQSNGEILFCHRHIVAYWFYVKLGKIVTELLI